MTSPNVCGVTIEKFLPADVGTSTETYNPAGTIYVSLDQIGSSATNTTQTLLSYSLPASTLDTNGAVLEVEAWGSKAANAAPLTLQLNVGGASINSGSSTGSGFSWRMKGTGGRRGSNVQRYYFNGERAALGLTASSTGDTSTDSAAITISVQALDASAAQSNVLLDGLVIRFFKAS